MDARMGVSFAAARVQLRSDPGGKEQPASVGPETSTGSGLAIRIGMAGTADALIVQDWRTPDRGIAGVLSFIVAEAALFSIFVVGYLFYLGKSLNGPYPDQVLKTPVLATICLLSSSGTILFAERA